MSGPRLVIISGLSGSGKSTAARALEDEGFFVVDNLPVVLLSRLLEVSREYLAGAGDLAIVLDVRNQSFLAGCDAALEEVRQAGYGVEILFFEASDASLLRRYSETRRRHPLALQDGVLDGIKRERELLIRLRDQATAVTDTSQLTPHQLRTQVVQVVRSGVEAMHLSVLLQSFGFRYGIPSNSDLVMDIRFLPNPHFVTSLRGQSGLDPAVRDYVLNQRVCQKFFQRFQDLLTFLLPHYRQEGKSYLTISVGCTGGRHRSVAVVEALRSAITGDGITLQIAHRDIDKG